jgi:serine/threonine protein kinase
VSNVSISVHSPVLVHFSGACANMEAASSEVISSSAMQSTSAVSSLGWNSPRANAMNTSAVHGLAWRDVSSFSSNPSPSHINFATAGDQGQPGATAATATTATTTAAAAVEATSRASAQAAGLSLKYGDAQPSNASVVLPMQYLALAKGVNEFCEFVAHLPSVPSAAPTTISTFIPDTHSKGGGSHPRSLDATGRPHLTHGTSVTSAGGDGVYTSAGVHTTTQVLGSPSSPARISGQLPPSTVPAHRICTATHTDQVMSPVPATQPVGDAPTSTASPCRRAGAAVVDPPKASGCRNELVQIQSSESGFVIVATRQRPGREPCGVEGGSGEEEEEDSSRPSSPMPVLPANTASSPYSSPSDALHESVWATLQNGEPLTSSGNNRRAGEAFQRYLDQTRETVLNAQVSEDERAAALDELLKCSRELFDLLDGMHTPLVDSAERRHYSTLRGMPYDAMLTSPTNVELSVRPPARCDGSASPEGGSRGRASVVAAATLANTDETVFSAGEPLTHTTRAAPTQLPYLANGAALSLLGRFERGRRNSLTSCSTTNVAYIDIVNHYCVLRLIGIGATGRAYLALDRKTNNYYAMKTVAKHTRRSTVRQFPLRAPSSLSEECSVMESAAPMSSMLDNSTKLPSRHMAGGGDDGGGSASFVGNAAGAVSTSIREARGTPPSSITRTTCFTASAVLNAKAAGEARTEQQQQEWPGAGDRGLREEDIKGFAQPAGHTSGIVIPYVESVMTGESSSTSAADETSREKAVQAVLVQGEELSRPGGALPSISFARRTDTDPLHVSSNNSSAASSSTAHSSRPPIAPTSIRAATSGALPKDKSSSLTDGELCAVEREIRVMRRVQNHPHVVQLKEVIDDDDEDCVHLIMTYAANGPLAKVHGYDPVLGSAVCNVVRPVSRCARLLRQLAEALTYVHRQRIVHNDVKPDNILLTDGDNILLTDFGESVLIPKHVQLATAPSPQHSLHIENSNATVVVPHNRWKPPRAVGDSWLGGGVGGNDFNEQSMPCWCHSGSAGNTLTGVSQTLMTEVSFLPDSSMFLAAGVDGNGRLNGDRTIVGSPAFAAPELIERGTCSYSSDTWSYGVVMYAIVFGRLPFAGPSISSTFDEILHAPLTFPPFEKVPQNAELTEAAYDQLVMLCSRLLVREPQQRLSLHSLLRHPLFRATMPPPLSPRSTNTDTLSSSRPSVSNSRQPSPDNSSGRRRSAQAGHSFLSQVREEDEEGLSPISRTIRSRPFGDAVSPPRSASNESLSLAGSPTFFPGRAAQAGEGGTDSRIARALTANTTVATAALSPSVTSLHVPAPTPPRISPAAVICVPTPPATRREKVPSPPVKQPALVLPLSPSKQAADVYNTPTQTNQNSFTQLPPFTSAPKAADTLLPNCFSSDEDPVKALPAPPRHLPEKTLICYQPPDLTASARTVSPKEASLFSVSNWIYTESRHGSVEQTPVSLAEAADSATEPPPASMKVARGGETRAHGTHVREPVLAPMSLRAPQQTRSEAVKDGTEVRRTSHVSAALASCLLPPPEPNAPADTTEHVAGDVSTSGSPRKPQEDRSDSSNLDEAFSQQDVVADYYSYWNNSESDAGSSGSSSGEKAEHWAAAGTSLLLAPVYHTHCNNHSGPYTPHDVPISRTPVRHCIVGSRTRAMPVLSNREEVLGSKRRSRGSVVRTKREKCKSVDERRPFVHPLPNDCEGVTPQAPVKRKEVPRRAADGKRSTVKSSLPDGDRRNSNSLSRSAVQEVRYGDEPKTRQAVAPVSKSWFKRRR